MPIHPVVVVIAAKHTRESIEKKLLLLSFAGGGEWAPGEAEEPTAAVATRLAGKRHPEQGQIGGREERDTGAAPRRSARSGPSGRPHEARSNPGPREMTAAASSARTDRHRIRLTARLSHALI